MRHVVKFSAWTAACAITCAALAQTPAAPLTPIAHSAFLTVDGTVAADTLVLRVRRAADQQTLGGAQLQVAIDGRSLPAAPRPEGTWGVPLGDLPARSPGKLEIVVAHDGVREVLDGQLPSGRAGAPSAGGPGGIANALVHKQMAWWILNVVIVLIGVIAISRRMS
jgi:hypothetical protein